MAIRFTVVPAADRPGWHRLHDSEQGCDLTGLYATENSARLAAFRLNKQYAAGTLDLQKRQADAERRLQLELERRLLVARSRAGGRR